MRICVCLLVASCKRVASCNVMNAMAEIHGLGPVVVLFFFVYSLLACEGSLYCVVRKSPLILDTREAYFAARALLACAIRPNLGSYVVTSMYVLT